MPFAARIQDGVVAEVVRVPPHLELDDMFHPDAGFIMCPDDVEAGMTYDGASYGPPQPVVFEEKVEPYDPPVRTTDGAAAGTIALDRHGRAWKVQNNKWVKA